MRISDWSSDVCSSDLSLHLSSFPHSSPRPAIRNVRDDASCDTSRPHSPAAMTASRSCAVGPSAMTDTAAPAQWAAPDRQSLLGCPYRYDRPWQENGMASCGESVCEYV